MKISSISLRLSLAVFFAACTSQPQKPCLCEPVAVQSSCPQSLAAPEITPNETAVAEDSSDNEAKLVEADLGNAEEKNDSIAQKPLPDSSSIIEESDLSASDMPREYVVVGSGLNIRSGPSMESPIVGSLKVGDTVRMMGREGVWVMISQDQYVSIKHLKDK